VLTSASLSSPSNSAAPLLGANATFSVQATGSATFNYQWQFNNTDIVNATNRKTVSWPITSRVFPNDTANSQHFRPLDISDEAY
jgi:hypothetical protein